MQWIRTKYIACSLQIKPTGNSKAQMIRRLPMSGTESTSGTGSDGREYINYLPLGELRSSEDYHDAAFIFQHGTSPDDFLLAHVLATTAVSLGDAASRWIVAATLDRYLQSIKRSQVFGTQYFQEDSPKPWTQESYDRDLLPDALRVIFGVPTRLRTAEDPR
jgi:hypothetical protein